VLGFAESFAIGVYGAGLFVALHNYFARRWAAPRQAGSDAKVA